MSVFLFVRALLEWFQHRRRCAHEPSPLTMPTKCSKCGGDC